MDIINEPSDMESSINKYTTSKCYLGYMESHVSNQTNLQIETIKTEDETCTRWIVAQDNNKPLTDHLKETISPKIKSEENDALVMKTVRASTSIPGSENVITNTSISKRSFDEKTIKLVEVWKSNCQLSYRCATCNKEFLERSSGLVHLKIHADKKPYVCGTCGEIFEKIGDYFGHKKTHQSEVKTRKLNECDKRLNVNESRSGKFTANLQEHQSTYEGKKPYKCTSCHKRFIHKKRLQVHQRSHNICTVCKATFSQVKHLQEHQLTHTAKHPYKCSICAKRFRFPKVLHRHQLTHGGGKPCTICKTTCSQLHHLQDHQMPPTKENPYKCKWCTRSFKWPNGLQIHQLSHKGEKPYKCTFCPREYRLLQTWGRHQDTHRK